MQIFSSSNISCAEPCSRLHMYKLTTLIHVKENGAELGREEGKQPRCRSGLLRPEKSETDKWNSAINCYPERIPSGLRETEKFGGVEGLRRALRNAGIMSR